jgi:Methyltransferase domain
MTRPELAVIAHTAATVPERGLIIEIGSFAGRSSVHWAANSRPSVDVCCIDPFDHVIDEYSYEHIQGDARGVRGRASGELFAEHTGQWFDRLIAIAVTSPPVSWDRPADVILVDGDHTPDGVDRDLRFWVEWVKPCGRLLGHDWDDVRVRNTVEAFAIERGLDVQVHNRTCIWELHPVGGRFA